MPDTWTPRWFSVPARLEIRLCREADLPQLEWFGMYSEHREIIRSTYESQERGETAMLVADLNGFPAGQVWINLTLK